MSLRILPIIFSLFLIAAFFSTPTFAAKKFVRKQTTAPKASSGSIPSIAKYRSDKQGVLLSFSNFKGIESISYSFTYTTNGTQQGAGGTLTAANNPTTERELLFGTCSHGVCTYHRGLSDARLVLTARLTKGKTITRSYRIKTYQ